MCESDEYLLNYCDDLKTQTPPVTRKRFIPVPIDRDKSFGLVQNGEDWEFDNTTTVSKEFNLNNVTDVDMDKSTILYDGSQGGIVLPTITTEESVINVDTHNTSPLR